MDWTPVSYAYDGSFAGFLTCVFASYAHREEPMSFSTPEDGRISLWPERTVDTDEARAQRVYRSLADESRFMSLSLTVEATTIITPKTPEVAIIISVTLSVPVA